MSEYNQEQSKTIQMVRNHLKTLSRSEQTRIKTRIRSYLLFRKEVAEFLQHHFSELCTQKCYQNHYSACCGREGITTFFADVLVNVLMSSEKETGRLLQVLGLSDIGAKCVYLGKTGCLWRIKPIVCEMFLCEHARKTVFGRDPLALKEWKRLRLRNKRYTWPNRPVLFDDLESCFIRAGHSSTLMYFHNSPGLLRVKRLAAKKRETALQESHRIKPLV
ncbi:MAG: hypothetical protein BA861_12260 [Desulfobacterales bacterium S3730MH5]|nr:MAG: hypothetical protein BA861_12260 [Desulfobacterales bacterium S3730MH5]OEU80215.1 MAG: hypothetical protein BA865_04435 [Desulfobacterales bacterium S5133MH4]